MKQFPHCQTITGVWTSVCMSCFLTIATSDTENKLAADESAHVCEPFQVVLRGIAHRHPSRREVIPGPDPAPGVQVFPDPAPIKIVVKPRNRSSR